MKNAIWPSQRNLQEDTRMVRVANVMIGDYHAHSPSSPPYTLFNVRLQYGLRVILFGFENLFGFSSLMVLI